MMLGQVRDQIMLSLNDCMLLSKAGRAAGQPGGVQGEREKQGKSCRRKAVVDAIFAVAVVVVVVVVAAAAVATVFLRPGLRRVTLLVWYI